jgi:hypothetical protein
VFECHNTTEHRTDNKASGAFVSTLRGVRGQHLLIPQRAASQITCVCCSYRSCVQFFLEAFSSALRRVSSSAMSGSDGISSFTSRQRCFGSRLQGVARAACETGAMRTPASVVDQVGFGPSVELHGVQATPCHSSPYLNSVTELGSKRQSEINASTTVPSDCMFRYYPRSSS